MIHFEYAFVALRAMMSSIGFGSQASGTHSDSSKLFAFKAHYLGDIFLGFFEELGMLQLVERSSLALDEPVVEVTGLSRILLVLNDLLVVEIFHCWSSLLDFLAVGKVLIIGHVPLGFDWNLTRIRNNRQD